MPDNIDVNPGLEDYAVSVATDLIGNTHYPIYKISFGIDGSQTPVSEADPLPVDATPIELAEQAYVQQENILEAIENLEVQLKIMNVHLQSMTNEKITKGDIDG